MKVLTKNKKNEFFIEKTIFFKNIFNYDKKKQYICRMIYLIIAIICSTMFAVLFKIFQRSGINSLSCILLNYIFGTLIMIIAIMTKGNLQNLINCVSTTSIHLSTIIIYASLPALMFLIGFVAMDQATFRCGIALTTIAARAALVIPLMLSWLILDDNEPNWLYVILIFIAMALIMIPNSQQTHPNKVPYQSSSDKSRNIKSALSLISVFIVYGLADFFINLSNVKVSELHIQPDILTMCIFMIATFFCTIYCSCKGVLKLAITYKTIIGGILLGFANVGCTYMVINGINALGASLFYPTYYIGIVITATILGFCCFKEKIKLIQLCGLVLAGVAIFLIKTS